MKMPGFLKKIIFLVFARPFVAGQTIEDAIRVAKKLREKNIHAIINILGEHVKSEKEASQIRYEYLKLITRLKTEGLYNTHISVKPSQLGIEISEDLYKKHLGQILLIAKFHLPKALVEIDRETHNYALGVRKVSLDFAKAFPNQRLACQINLNETLEEIQQLIEAGLSIRLCKGTAYLGDISDEREIRKRFLEQAFLLSEGGNRPAIATHDLYLIDRLKNRNNLGYQALLGIENKELEQLAKENKEVGFYIPCGSNWWSYGKRRGRAILKIWWRNWWYRINTRKEV